MRNLLETVSRGVFTLCLPGFICEQTIRSVNSYSPLRTVCGGDVLNTRYNNDNGILVSSSNSHLPDAVVTKKLLRSVVTEVTLSGMNE